MSTAWWLTADVRAALAAIPDGSIDLVLTSPPFLALRSYLPADHPDKALEIGSEDTPAEFLATLLALTDEFARVLAPHGSIAIELGDTYSGSGGGGGDYLDGGWREGQQQFAGSAASMRESNAAHWRAKNRAKDAWPQAKSLTFVPQLYGASLAYGRNLLTGEPCRQWRVRNVVAWVRPNPPVGALGDKFRPATSYMTVACLGGKRWFDLDAVREAHTEPGASRQKGGRRSPGGGGDQDNGNPASGQNPAGAPPLDWWCIPPGGYPGSHYAVFPPELLVRPIKAMCPHRVCTVCGRPSERIVETGYLDGKGRVATAEKWGSGIADGKAAHTNKKTGAGFRAVNETVGWSDCGHSAWRNGRVLDPFGGSGTTALVATGHGRDCLSIDLDARNADLAYQRVGGLIHRDIDIDDVPALLAQPDRRAH